MIVSLVDSSSQQALGEVKDDEGSKDTGQDDFTPPHESLNRLVVFDLIPVPGEADREKEREAHHDDADRVEKVKGRYRSCFGCIQGWCDSEKNKSPKNTRDRDEDSGMHRSLDYEWSKWENHEKYHREVDPSKVCRDVAGKLELDSKIGISSSGQWHAPVSDVNLDQFESRKS